jgi:hypothetical protein
MCWGCERHDADPAHGVKRETTTRTTQSGDHTESSSPFDGCERLSLFAMELSCSWSVISMSKWWVGVSAC